MVEEKAAPHFSGNFRAYRDININVNQPLEIGRNAVVMLAKSVSTLIVDLFRMLYVLGSKEAEVVNINRFEIFFGIADDHARELSSLVGRLINGISSENFEAIIQIERNCSWVLRQIKYRSDVNFNITMCFSQMTHVVNENYELLCRMIPEDLRRIKEEVDCEFQGFVPSDRFGSIENMRIRLFVQSKIIKNRSSGNDVRTIAHDPSQDYSVHYFLIDRRCLLCMS